MTKKREIRNSTAEFLTFIAAGKEDGIQVLYKDDTIWATQKAMASLFDCSTDNIGLHLKNIFDSGELIKESTTEKISAVQTEGERLVKRNTMFYNLDAIISVGYRVNSIRATQFRQWCTYVIRKFSLRGYVIRTKGSGTLTRCSFCRANCRKKEVITGCGHTRGKTLRRRGLRISSGRDAHAPSGCASTKVKLSRNTLEKS